jgi:hypothetical protein
MVAPISSRSTSLCSSGRPRQFIEMALNSRCSILQRGQDLSWAELLLDLLAQPLDRGRVGAVASHPDRLAAGSADPIDHGLDPGRVGAVDRHLGAVGGR